MRPVLVVLMAFGGGLFACSPCGSGIDDAGLTDAGLTDAGQDAGLSAAERCRWGISLTCEKTYECVPDAGSIPTNPFGTSVADCKTKFEAAQGCASKRTENELCQVRLFDGGVGGLPDAGTYNLGKALECADAIRAQSCADFQDASKRPEACGLRCGPP